MKEEPTTTARMVPPKSNVPQTRATPVISQGRRLLRVPRFSSFRGARPTGRRGRLSRDGDFSLMALAGGGGTGCFGGAGRGEAGRIEVLAPAAWLGVVRTVRQRGQP